MTFLGILPWVSLAALVIALRSAKPTWGWGKAFLRATLLWGGYTVVSTEGLSLLEAVTPWGLGISWGAALAVSLGVSLKFTPRGKLPLPRFSIPHLGTSDWLVCVGVLAILIVTAVVAWRSPPNTWDSMTYHMSRVAHWAQNRSLRLYATGIERQNFMSPGAEIAVLNVYVLGRGDQWANFVDWFAMLGCLAGAWVVAAQLGAPVVGRLLAAAFVASLPMGIAQASSTMTDYVEALWVICVASEILTLSAGEDLWSASAFASLGAGLAILTKPTALAYLPPWAILAVFVLLTKEGPARSMAKGLAGLSLIFAINAGYLVRNSLLTGSIVGSSEMASKLLNEFVDWRVIVSNVVRNASLHAGTPSAEVNSALYLAIAKIHVKIGLEDVADPRTTLGNYFGVRSPLTSENQAGNTQQAVVLVLAAIYTFSRWRHRPRAERGYLVLLVSVFVLYSAVFQFYILGSRYHLPFFILAAPYVGSAVPSFLGRNGARLVGLGLVVLSWQWLVSIDNRPILPMSSDFPSVLVSRRNELYFPPATMEEYQRVAREITRAKCTRVGVMLCGDCPEYPFWSLLGAPVSGIRIEWIVAGTPSDRFRDPAFAPCAVVCDRSCPADWESVRSLQKASEIGPLRLYLGEDE